MKEYKRPGESFWWYVKRRHVPTECPSCGVEGAWKYKYRIWNMKPRPAPWVGWEPCGSFFTDVLKEHYGGWHRELETHPLWRFKIWRGRCRDCAFDIEMTRPSFFLQSIAKSSEWSGGTIAIPFGSKR